ncbi:RidA family protein [Dethiobacter alkaliphilus]|uniref:RidA family protein n=1 Tax=Dethiobacter alkaliphilus TaxID=427926 RepID=UPI00222633CE|nr:RidA family protein [Dethiobacter alkaliphilus]MCW3491585.1 RidA family protein [Dethiobacter alkaliphilus]
MYVGGQNAVDEEGNVVGAGDLAVQAKQVLQNVEKAVKAAGGQLENIVKWNIYLVEGQDPGIGFAAFQQVAGHLENPPAITVVKVAGFAHPDFLLEMDSVAVLPL